MKTKIVILLVLIFTSYDLKSQNRLILQSDLAHGKDADLSFYYPNTNYGSLHRFRVDAWTYGGVPEYVRDVLAFDLSQIPTFARITKATLSLYHTDDMDNSTLSGSNACWLQRIITPWNEKTVTWNTQPKTTDENQVAIEASNSVNQNYPSIDVTMLVQDMVNKPDSSFGFMIRLQTEQRYRRLCFASRENADPQKRPRLTVDYFDCKEMVKIYDTIRIYNKIEIYDTIRIYDRIKVYDTINVYEPVYLTFIDTATYTDTIKVTVTNRINVAVTDTLKINVDLTNRHITNTVTVYPNPTTEMIYIDNGNYLNMKNYTIKIMNPLSHIIYFSKIDRQIIEINLNLFAAVGLYFIQIYDDNNKLIENRKIVLE